MEPESRLFLAISLPEFIRSRLAELQSELPNLRRVQNQNLHLTLKFIGNADPERISEIRRVLKDVSVKPFLIALGGTGTFPERGDPTVVWVGVNPIHPRLTQLHKSVNDTLMTAGIEPDRRIYRPHVTLARCKGLNRQTLKPFLRKNEAFATAPFRVECFSLLSSEIHLNGPVYTRLEAFPLDY